jgi:hypothetical protein
MSEAEKDRRFWVVAAVCGVLFVGAGDLAVAFYASLGCGIGENNSPAVHDALCGRYTWMPMIGAAVMVIVATASRARNGWVFLSGVAIGAVAGMYTYVAMGGL